jgi:outer membrane receptor protein involved in Fe transport
MEWITPLRYELCIRKLNGLSEVDVQSVELLPGASSALYGANAFNGILFMTSRSPFTSQGITGYAKFGQTSQKSSWYK